ncbi:MAG: energy-coupling factor transporter transmembrane protein EcfT [Clostridiales bacterium]|nr:energy-coupling factor transporter transmembrane protein EcfT [Clostridiales bacterium]
MIRDITLGQYFPGESILHRLDPRLKIVVTLAYIVLLFVVKEWIGFAACFAFLAMAVALSKVPLSFILRGLKVIFIIILFTFVLNLFMYDGTVLVRIWKLTITDQGLYRALFMAGRLILLIISSSLLTLTTTPIQLTNGLERLMKPLSKIGVPSHEIAMMMSIALRFIPTLLDETDKIMKAQQARGADFETGNILHRAKQMIPILVPLFISAFRIAQDMALAMEARCYRGGEGRTSMNEMRFRKRDYIAAGILLLFAGGIIALRILV